MHRPFGSSSPHEPSCSCFGWCGLEDMASFLRALPAAVSSRSSPWFDYVSNVYSMPPVVPFSITTFGVFRFSRKPALDHAFDVDCQLPTCRSRAPRCGGWITAPQSNMTGLLPWRGGAPLAPWPWTGSTRAKFGARSMMYKWLLAGGWRVHLEWTHASRAGSRRKVPASLTLWRSSLRPPAPAQNHTWVEAFRVRTTPRPEGVLYGCWFYPLLEPYVRGAGSFVNVGRTLVLEGRYAATLRFRTAYQQDARGRSYVTFRGERIFGDKDFLWAIVAQQWGYDSVQILHGPGGQPEMMVSRDACLTQTHGILTCPPVELRTGSDASLPCVCSDGEEMLNCNG